MSVSDFFDFLLGRDATRDLALELAYVYDGRRRRSARAEEGR